MTMLAVIPAQSSTAHTTCEWHATLGAQHTQVVVVGWSDDNPVAQPLRALVMQMDSIIGAAQDRGAE